MDYLAQVNISRRRIQARHEAGGCNCLLPREKECLFITPTNRDEQPDDENWTPLKAYLEHPELIYKSEDLLAPVLIYLKLEQVDGRVLTIADIKMADIVHYYNNVWNRD